ncbi:MULTISPECIES: LytR/AlgR family response regulator transcription factor [Flavobacteriaceae]|uniref:LytR/AlgR family response regulator transcription factor n=1 Tax=Flavobacteriaceae TaxID=49546 RepID=UPI001490EF44|nr:MULTISPECIES: LytTR family transcriptional regulator DNA-binding domain-containing protein [Allomuricauda]MDC6366852.1 LytTR family transcriptional regulator DNA-binding domain-containing protein [Muricauda sp. AC10]
MTCIIVEDQPPAQRILKKYIDDMESLVLVGTFQDSMQAMEYLKLKQAELMFLDIHLPKLSGIEFLKTMKKPPLVILTTAFSEYALESYELNVVDYLLKPFSFQRFVQAVSKAFELNGQKEMENKALVISNRQEIYVKSGYEHVKVALDSITHITSNADYTEINTRQKKYLSNESLRYWLETLPKNQFYRIHKSYIVNTNGIEKIAGNQLYLIDGAKLPIGRSYKEDFLKKVLG